jgi:hypothetical protein
MKNLKNNALIFNFAFFVFNWSFAGDIEGYVKFPGETPPPAMIANARDKTCPYGIAQNHLIVRQENRGLKNSLVILDFKEDRPVTKATPLGLKVEGCTFLPRVQWTTLPAYLTLTNQDETQEEVLATIDGVQAFRVDLSGKATTLRRPLSRARLHRIDSPVHPWMRAWIYVAPHPFVAQTDASGFFRIRNAPAGTYDIRAWHEGWKEKERDRSGGIVYQPVEEVRRVKVPAKGTVTVYFEDLEPSP